MGGENKSLIEKGKGDTGAYSDPSFSSVSDSVAEKGDDVKELKRENRILKTLWENLDKKVENIKELFKAQGKLLNEQKKKLKSIEDRIARTELRSIEIIGIISAIIALVLVFVDTANKHISLKNSYTILVTGVMSLIIFASLLHHFFNKDEKRNWKYYLIFIILPIIIIGIIGFFVFSSSN